MAEEVTTGNTRETLEGVVWAATGGLGDLTTFGLDVGHLELYFWAEGLGHLTLLLDWRSGHLTLLLDWRSGHLELYFWTGGLGHLTLLLDWRSGHLELYFWTGGLDT